MDRLVEVARFQYPTVAHMVEAMLRAREIECVLQNEYSTILFGGYADVGGVRIEVMEKDVKKAISVIDDFGYSDYLSYEKE